MLSKSVLLSSLLSPMLALALSSCGSEGSDGGDNPAVDAGDVAQACAPTPSRLIVLGDSISACAGVGNKDASTCGPKMFHSSLEAGYAPGLVYQNLAVNGAITADVPDRQLASVATGPGHVLVLIFVGGNDIQTYLLKSDAEAQAGIQADLPKMATDWRSTFAYFNDTANFPDGATIIMNNQYNPFDDCTAPPYNLSPIKTELLTGDYNGQLASLADEFDNVTLTDQHTPYLGHGHHYDVASCPNYEAGLTPYMQDLIHPNADGHANLAAQWSLTADGLYRDCE